MLAVYLLLLLWCGTQQGRLPRRGIKAVERSALPGRMEFELIGTQHQFLTSVSSDGT